MVKVSVEVDEAEFDKAIDAAFRKIAREVNIPGFRAGKAPRRILEARIGSEAARQQALQDSIPEYLARAVREQDVDIIAPPKIDITSGEDNGSVSFDAEIQVRPQITVPGYGGLRVEIANPTPSEEEIGAQLDRMRQPFASVNDVERPAANGDLVSIDLVGSSNGEVLPGLEVTDYLYTVGSGQIVPELDEELIGAEAGDELNFSADHPVEDRDPIDFEITVKVVRERVLPELTDQWAGEASEFDTFEELRADLVRRMTTVRAIQAQMALREKVIEALVSLVEDEAPEPMVNQEFQHRAEDLVMRLQAQGMSVEQYVMMQGKTPSDLTDELRDAAVKGVKADLALRAVAAAEDIQVDEEDLELEYSRIAQRANRKPNQVRKDYERNDAVSHLVAELRKRKALDWLVEQCEIVDLDGQPIDRAALNPVPAADDNDEDDTEVGDDA